jgi:glyoxylase-like metal-dependent hydrolase (beta-lactamase superfamily II)
MSRHAHVTSTHAASGPLVHKTVTAGATSDASGMDRRIFITNLGKATLAVAVMGPVIAACGVGSSPMEAATWHRVPFSSVGVAISVEEVGIGAAFVVVRDGEAAVIDTGQPDWGDESLIEDALTAVGLGWDAVGHVIVTHHHVDHRGNLPAVMTLASNATGYAGAADIPVIAEAETLPRPLTAVGDGDSVFGLDIIETPGHTPGHICALDPVGNFLVAGDALNGSDWPRYLAAADETSVLVGPFRLTTEDVAQANESVKKLAGYSFDTALFGHGSPVVGDAGDQLAELAANL